MMTPYDSIPYPSYSYPQSSPARLSAVAQLFGLSPVNVETANVLEIGCASGGNLLPLAARFPKSKFLGIDLSSEQIKVAQEKAETLKVSNIDFVAASILDHDFEQQKFDYIIVHGVYSWVPNPVQERILEVCGTHLSQNGLAYISYNTLPGWNMVKTIRDMMLYHGQNFEDPAQKVAQARNMLKFAVDNIKEQSGPYKQLLENEMTKLQTVSDNYLLHDHLEDINDPCYFYEFADKAAQHGLTYLGDTDLPSMYLGNQSAKVSETLRQMGDPVRQEQYLDFINNRRFRMSILFKGHERRSLSDKSVLYSPNEIKINRNVTPERLTGLRFVPKYKVETSIDKDMLGKIEQLDLVGIQNSGLKATLKGRILCSAMIEILRALPVRMTLAEIVEASHAYLQDVPKDKIEKDVAGFLLQSIFNGIFEVFTETDQPTVKPGDLPSAFKSAILASQKDSMVANLHHETIKLSDDQRLVIQYVNGKNTREQISNSLKNHIAKGELVIQAKGEKITADHEQYDDMVQHYLERMLSTFALNALLEA